MRYPEIIEGTKLIEIVINKSKKEQNQKDVLFFINFTHKLLSDRLNNILNTLPDYKKMQEYYLLMSKNIVPENTLEKHKNHYIASIHLVNSLSERYKRWVKKEVNYSKKLNLKKEYLGRIRSVLKKLNTTNQELKSYARLFREIPNPKKLFTILLIGAPNTGKTTLLSEITSSAPEINTYAFTTKSLNFGYFKKREEVIQVVDTPGLIHTDFKDMNYIEKQTIVAIKTLADVIIFLYNQYQSEAEQTKILYKIIKENPNKNIFVYPSFGGNLKNYKEITKKQILNKDFV